MVKDFVQLLIWAILGFVVTWGDFLAWYGFRESEKKYARALEIFTLVIGIAWIMLWVSAVIFNLIQITGDPTWRPMKLASATST